MNEDGQRADMEKGQRVLSAIIEQPVTTIAYPYGAGNDFDADSARITAELGHSSACTAIRGFNEADTDPMRLHRVHAAPYSAQELSFYLLWRGL